MATHFPTLECCMYEASYPEVDMVVMIQVKNIDGMGAYVSVLEYNNIEGMILFSKLSSCWIRSVSSLITVGCIKPVMVLRVDKEKGYINLSKRRVSEEDSQACEESYNKSKLVHSIMRHVARTLGIDLEAFKIIVTDPDSVLNALICEVQEIGPDGQEVIKVIPAVSEELKEALVRNIRRRMNPKPFKIWANNFQEKKKIRADIEMKCFQLDGVLHIKEAMRKAEATGNDDCPVKIKLVAPPLYVLTTQTLNKEQGLAVLNKAITVCSEAIEEHKGKLAVKEASRAVSLYSQVSEQDDTVARQTHGKVPRGQQRGGRHRYR